LKGKHPNTGSNHNGYLAVLWSNQAWLFQALFYCDSRYLWRSWP
jgi:hypothetical protein